MQRWLSRPVLALRVEPGPREAYEEAGSVGHAAPAGRRRQRSRRASGRATIRRRSPATSRSRRCPYAAREPMPQVSGNAALDFPATERARLSNGIQIVYARRNVVPVTRIAVEFNAGIAADPADRLGTQAMMLNLLEEGTTHLNSTQIAEAQERLGARIDTGASLDRTTVSLTALTPNLGPSLDLLADVIRNPAFAPGEVERVRQQQLECDRHRDDPAPGHRRPRAAAGCSTGPTIPMGSRAPAAATPPRSGR